MQTTNPLYTSIIVTEKEIISALHFDYEEAKQSMKSIFKGQFNPLTDDGLIFENTKAGEGKPVFSYRAFLNGEKEPTIHHAKENKHVKIYFECPKCKGTKGKLKPDEDQDLFMICSNCNTSIYVS